MRPSWEQITPTQWRFHLRKGVKFHDGSPFTADDVVFSFGRILQPQGTNQIYVSGVKEMKKIDDYTVDAILSGPDPVLLRLFVDFRIMSKAWSVKNKAENIQDYKAKGRELCLAQRQRHRPLHHQAVGAGQAHRDDGEPGLVGQARRQRDRGDLYADQVRRDARLGAALRRCRPGHRPADAGRRAAAQRPQDQGARRRRESAPFSSAWTSTIPSCCIRTSRARTRSRTCACARR